MSSAFEFEDLNLLDKPTDSKKQGVSKKFKIIAFVNILVILYFAHSAFVSTPKSADFSSLRGHALYSHMKSTMSTPDMANFHSHMRALIHAGALDEFNKYDAMVDEAKTKSTDVGNQIKEAQGLNAKIKGVIDSLASGNIGNIATSVGLGGVKDLGSTVSGWFSLSQ